MKDLIQFKIIEINGIKIKARSSDLGVINEVFKENPYRLEEIPIESTVLDIGAHIGIFTLRCAKERNCFVYSYEPSIENYSILIENLKINNLEDKVKAYNKCVASKKEMREFYVNPKSPASSSLYLDFYKEYSHLSPELVQCTNLKSIFEDNRLYQIDLLKMDCEEAEMEIFNDEGKPYFKKMGYIVLEWHNYDGHIYARYLKNIGFDVKLFGTGLPQPKYKRSMVRGMLYAKNIHFQ